MSNNLEQFDSKGRSNVSLSWVETAGAQLSLPQPMQDSNQTKVTGLPELMLCAGEKALPGVDSSNPFMTDVPDAYFFMAGFGRWGQPRNKTEVLAADFARDFNGVDDPSNRYEFLEQSLKKIYEQHGPTNFAKFAGALPFEMNRTGIKVYPLEDGIAFRSVGQGSAVEFKLKSKVDLGSGRASDIAITSKVLDWVTKADVDLGANGVQKLVSSMGVDKGAARKEEDKGRLCDASELSLDFWVEVLDRRKLEKFNGTGAVDTTKCDLRLTSNLNASFSHAYKIGGLKAVQKLAAEINHAEFSFIKEDERKSAILIVDKETPGELRIYRGFEVSPKEARLASVMSAEQLNKVGIVKHQRGVGYFNQAGAAVVIPLSLNDKSK